MKQDPIVKRDKEIYLQYKVNKVPINELAEQYNLPVHTILEIVSRQANS